MVWFSGQLEEHFRPFGILKPVARLNTAIEEPALPGFVRTYWRVALPLPAGDRGASKALLAVAELERQNPFVKVLDFTIQTDPENPAQRVGGMNVAMLVRK